MYRSVSKLRFTLTAIEQKYSFMTGTAILWYDMGFYLADEKQKGDYQLLSILQVNLHYILKIGLAL